MRESGSGSQTLHEEEELAAGCARATVRQHCCDTRRARPDFLLGAFCLLKRGCRLQRRTPVKLHVDVHARTPPVYTRATCTCCTAGSPSSAVTGHMTSSSSSGSVTASSAQQWSMKPLGVNQPQSSNRSGVEWCSKLLHSPSPACL